MAGLNKVYILGRLGADPELKNAGDKKVCRLSIATSEKYKDKETTTWHSIIVWGKLAEVCAQYLEKGSQALVEGKIQTRNYEKNGAKVYVTEILASSVQFLDQKTSEKSEDTSFPWDSDGGAL